MFSLQNLLFIIFGKHILNNHDNLKENNKNRYCKLLIVLSQLMKNNEIHNKKYLKAFKYLKAILS